MRLIDADVVIEKMHLDMCMDCIGGIKGGCHNCDYEHAMNVIENATTVDAVEVVRCKDCRYYFHFGKTSLLVDGKNVKAGWCQRRMRYDEEYRMTPTDYCSYGERKVSE